jgi:hypothetical protein
MEMDGLAGMEMGSGLNACAGVGMGAGATTHYTVECHDENGALRWVEEFDNLVVDTGLNELLSDTFKASAYTAAWYVGLTAGSPSFAAGNTMASHAGWTESAAYSEGARQTLTLGTVSGGSVSNSASKATFSVNATATIGGAFVANNSTKSGGTGVLYGGGAFTEGNRSVVNGDTLSVTVTLSVTAS